MSCRLIPLVPVWGHVLVALLSPVCSCSSVVLLSGLDDEAPASGPAVASDSDVGAASAVVRSY